MVHSANSSIFATNEDICRSMHNTHPSCSLEVGEVAGKRWVEEEERGTEAMGERERG